MSRELVGARILVTGGAGFIGSRLCKHLSEMDSEVTVLDDLSKGTGARIREISAPNVVLRKGNLNDLDVVREVCKDVEYVFHEAAISDVGTAELNPEQAYHVNVSGTATLLGCLVRQNLKRIVFASSAAVYGKNYSKGSGARGLQPASHYGWSKLLAENYCMYSYRKMGLPVTVLRYFNVYGPGSSFGARSNVINEFALRIQRREPIRIYGDGNNSRDFIHVDDVIRANLLAATNQGAAGTISDVGTGKSTTINRLSALVYEALRGKGNPIIEYFNPKDSDIVHSVADTLPAKKRFGFVAKISCKTGIQTYLSEVSATWSEDRGKFLPART